MSAAESTTIIRGTRQSGAGSGSRPGARPTRPTHAGGAALATGRHRLPFAIALLLSLSLSGCVTKGRYEELASERDELRGRLEATNEDLAATQSELAAAVSVNEDLENRIEAREVAIAATQATYSALADELRDELVAGQVVIEQLREGIRVQLAEEVLFDSGSADLGARGREILQNVSGQLEGSPYRIEVEGHTDDVPIGGRLAQRYETNWDLAAARAAHVVQLLQQSGVEGDRLVAVSYGDTRPVASNESAEGRAQNRRIEIRLIPVEDAAPAVASPPSEQSDE